MFVMMKNNRFTHVCFFIVLLMLISCKMETRKSTPVSANIQVDITNSTESVLYINNSFQLTIVGKFKNPHREGNIYTINEMPSYSNGTSAEDVIPYMVLLPSQMITVMIPKLDIHEPEDILLWICRENPSKEINKLPTMEDYRNILLKNGGVKFSFCQDSYNRVFFNITDNWTMPVTEKAISDIEDFVKDDYYGKWIHRDGIFYYDGE